MKSIRIKGHYIDPYTYSLINIDKVINISSEESAKKWARQTYFKATIASAEALPPSEAKS